MWPTISIVTPSLNQGRFLRQTIDSVLSQDYPALDYVVMDGASTDESVDILRSYGDRLAWVSEADGGQSCAINKGLARSRGSILAYLNSDDLLLPGALHAVAEHFQNRPEWDMLYGQAFHIDEHGDRFERYPTEPFSWERLLQKCIICQPAAFWRRRLNQRAGPFDECLHYAMDYEYWMRCARFGARIGHVSDYLACSRLHAQTKTLSARIKVYGEIFEVSRRYAARAGFGHYLAYWRHRLHERTNGWPRVLSRLPNAENWLALLHARWHEHNGKLRPLCGHFARALGRKLTASRMP